jgi:phenylalanyl-tRNA synthetase alpha chain
MREWAWAALAVRAHLLMQVDDMTEIATLQTRLLSTIDTADTPDALEAVRIDALGKQGSVSALLKSLGGMSADERQVQGPLINGLREAVTVAIADKKTFLETAALNERLATEGLDMTLPAPAALRGTVHPVSQVMDELAEIFADMGFAVAEGPEIEGDWHNFTALNIPETHPARAMHDTFYFPNKDSEGRDMLLRTHTSPVQIRTMKGLVDSGQKPPIRIIAPGRVYRSDSDSTHTPMFHQVEGLVIDKGIHLGHLKWTLETFLRAYFESEDITLRLRPSYFPFTEPSVEVDVGFSLVKGKRVLGGSENWMELLGSGMVHPKVLSNCGIDPDIYSGFAFGVGVDRLAMLKYGMDDLRAFFDGDVRWLNHYGFDALDVPTLSGGISA